MTLRHVAFSAALAALAFATAAFAASSARAGVSDFPASTWSAWLADQGVGATAPSTTRALVMELPFILRATEAAARGQSSASFWRTS